MNRFLTRFNTTHSGIISSRTSTVLRIHGFIGNWNAPLPILADPAISVAALVPRIFSADRLDQ